MSNTLISPSLRGKELIMATKQFASESLSRSWVHLLSTILALSVSLSLTLVIPAFALKLIQSALTGLLLVRMFIIYHDYQHHTILKGSKAARVVMEIFGYIILSPSGIWKRSHDHHHNNNSKLFGASIGSFPIATTEKFTAMSQKERFSYLAVRHPLTIALAYFSMFLFGMCISSFLSNPRRYYDGLLAPVVHVSISVCLFFLMGWQNWLCFAFLPFLIAHGIGAYLFYAQHNFPDATFACSADWAYDRAALESSSYMLMNPVMAWFTGNIGYHHIHHLNSKIPFYRLPEVMKLLPQLQKCKTTSLKIRDISGCLRLKCWDATQSRMVSLREMR